MKFDLIVADPPWLFTDKLTMDKTERGAESKYNVLTFDKLKELDIPSISCEDAVLALWVPSTLLKQGMELMEAWGFEQKQTWIWVKTKKPGKWMDSVSNFSKLLNVDKFIDVVSSVLAFGMGRLFRQTHELCLIGTRGKVYKKLENKSQRSVGFCPSLSHSAKPEVLQDRLEIMFPKANKLELFARRDRPGWMCMGKEAPGTPGDDVFESIELLKSV